MKKFIFILLLSSVFLLISAQKSLACSCVYNDKPLKQQVADAYRGSAAVLTGEVLEVTQKSEFELAVKIKVEKVWKGKLVKTITITTGKDSAMCGYSFEIGQKYLVYAYKEPKKLSTGLCTRTAQAVANQDYKYLDKLKKPVKVKST